MLSIGMMPVLLCGAPRNTTSWAHNTQYWTDLSGELHLKHFSLASTGTELYSIYNYANGATY